MSVSPINGANSWAYVQMHSAPSNPSPSPSPAASPSVALTPSAPATPSGTASSGSSPGPAASPTSGAAAIQQALTLAADSPTSALLSAITPPGSSGAYDSQMASVAASSAVWHGIDVYA